MTAIRRVRHGLIAAGITVLIYGWLASTSVDPAAIDDRPFTCSPGSPYTVKECP